ncbi:hypothetical protein [Paenibacillus kandeliae]|uniref:hypothetical protein n=1 Tax=Paenibacillus kandeliae TaxID=3231269 RepID=UPI003459C324
MGTANEQFNLPEHIIEAAEAHSEALTQYQKIIRAGIAQWVKDLQAGKIKMDTVQDLERLIELDIKIRKDELI